MTREHVVPKSIFTWVNLNKNLIVLPSCLRCNSSYWKIEEEFVHSLHLVRWLENEKILWKLQRRFNNPKLVKSNDKMRKSFENKQLNWELRLSLKLNSEIFDKCILKIIKGLYYNDFNLNIIFNDYEFIINRRDESDLSEYQQITKNNFLSKFNWEDLDKWEKFEGYFSYNYKVMEWCYIYKLVFYDDIEIYCILFEK